MEIKGQYLAYAEYRGLGGTLNLVPFNLLEFEARKQVDKYTFGRLINLEEQVQEVKLCIYNLVGLIDKYVKENTITTEEGKNIASENIDGYSVTYNTPKLTDIKSVIESKETEVMDIIETYLSTCKLEDGTPYLYRGADVN